MKIFLIGMTGAGKTTIGRDLAQFLSYNFIDMDDLIIKNEGTSIQEIFEVRGESYFRQKETEILTSFAESHENLVVSTGGGSPCFNDNISIINTIGTSIWIDPSPEALTKRLWASENKENRPMIKDLSEPELLSFIKSKLKDRMPFYSKSNFHLQSDNLTYKEIASLFSSNFLNS